MYDEERGRQKYLAYIQKSRELKAKTSYTKKIVVAGLYIEEYIYENEIIHGKKRTRRKKNCRFDTCCRFISDGTSRTTKNR